MTDPNVTPIDDLLWTSTRFSDVLRLDRRLWRKPWKRFRFKPGTDIGSGIYAMECPRFFSEWAAAIKPVTRNC